MEEKPQGIFGKVFRAFVRIVLVLIALVLLVAAGGVLVLKHYLDREGLKDTIEDAATKTFARQVTIGSVHWKVFPKPVVSLERVHIEEADHSLLLDCPDVQLTVLPWPFLHLTFAVQEVRFNSPHAVLKVRKDGVFNVERILSDIDAQSTSAAGQPQRFMVYRFVVDDGRLDYEIATDSGTFKLPLGVDGKAHLRWTVNGPQFPFDVSGHALDKTEAGVRLTGSLGSWLNLNFNVKHAPSFAATPWWPPAYRLDGRFSGSGDVSLRPQHRSWGFKVAAENPQLEGLTLPAHIEFAEKLVSVSTISFSSVLESSASAATVTGAWVQEKSRRFLTLRLESKRSDLLELIDWGKAVQALLQESRQNPGPNEAPKPAWRFEAEGSLADAVFRGQSFSRSTFHAAGTEKEPVAVRQVRIEGLGGSATGGADFTVLPSSTIFRATWTASGLNATSLFRLMGSSLQVTGICDSDGWMGSSLGGGFLHNLDGQVNFKLTRGYLEEVPGVLKIFSKMNLTSLINHWKGDTRRQRIPFNETTGTILFSHGTARTEKPVVLQNDTLQMGFMGSLNLVDNTVDGTVVVHILTVADEIISKIPIVNLILQGNKKSVLPIWVKVTGPVHDPKIDTAPLKSVASEVQGIFKRVFNLPANLFRALEGKSQR